jgi:hypothetical protein
MTGSMMGGGLPAFARLQRRWIFPARQIVEPLADFIFAPTHFAIAKVARRRKPTIAGHPKDGGAAEAKELRDLLAADQSGEGLLFHKASFRNDGMPALWCGFRKAQSVSA